MNTLHQSIFVGLFILFTACSSFADDYDVKRTQELLQSLGYPVGKVDGLYGKKTYQALYDYQKNHQLVMSGKINEETWKHLRKTEQEQKPNQSNHSEDIKTQNSIALSEKKIKDLVDEAFSKHLAEFKTLLAPDKNQKNLDTPIKKPENLVQNLLTEADNTHITTNKNISFIKESSEYQPQDDDQTIMVGTIAKRGKEKAIKKWQPLMNYLSSNMKGYYFKLKPGTLEELVTWGHQNKIDYLLTNPKMFVEFDLKHGFRPVATLRNLRLGSAYDVFGSVIFTRQDKAINSLEEAKGKTIGIVGHGAWGGWILGWHTFHLNGINPYDSMTVKPLGISQDKIVQAVIKGDVDVGVVRTDTIERMAQEGKIKQNELKLIHENKHSSDRFPFWLSSQLYPEWTFAASKKMTETNNKKIAALLLTLDEKSPIAKSSKNAGWTIPSSYQGVHDVLRDLRIAPYEDYGKITFQDILAKYWPILLAGLLLFSAAIFFSLYFRKLNGRLSQTNQELLNTQAQLVQSEKMAGIGMMAAGITHEINTPLAYAKSNAEMLRDELEDKTELLQHSHTQFLQLKSHLNEDALELVTDIKDRLDDHTSFEMIDYVEKGLNTIAELVVSLKNYSRLDRAEHDVIDIHEGLDSTLLIAKNNIKQVALIKKNYSELPKVECRPGQINQVIINLLTNAVQAIEEKKSHSDKKSFQGIVEITTSMKKPFILICITDNGIGIKKENQKNIFDPMFTTKIRGKGMGMGLSLSKKIIEKHHGKILFKSEYLKGTRFIIKLPILQPQK